jgi:hypothetical protein
MIGPYPELSLAFALTVFASVRQASHTSTHGHWGALMNSKRKRLPGMWLALAGMGFIAAPQLVAAAQSLQDEQLDEVTVKGTPLRRMRAELLALEDRFYALYNLLNKDKDFDVHCYSEAPLGTRLKSRICRVAYVEEAQADRGQAFVAGIRDGNSMRGLEAPAPESVEQARQDEYRTNVLKVINGDQRLLRLAHERVALEKRYLAELKRRDRK